LIVLYFGDRKDDDELLGKVDVNELVTGKTIICVRVPKAQPAEPAKASPVPADRLAAKDLWAAYGVTATDTFVVADKFGNPYATTQETALKDKLTEVASHFRALRKQLRKHVDAAEAAREKSETRAAVEALLEGFKLGVTGYNEAEAAAAMYGELIQDGRSRVKAAGADVSKLESLAAQFKGTDLESEIDAALKPLRKNSN
jgi:hypothetical protein